jgi:hypothetical protein
MRNKKTEIETELPDDYKPIPGTIVKVEDCVGGEIVAIAALFLAVLFLVLAVVRGF